MTLVYDAQLIDQRLRRRLTLAELFALALAVSLLGVFIWLQSAAPYEPYFDFRNYLKTAQGDFSFYYYGYWLAPIFSLLAKLPTNLSYLLWCLANILSVFFAARVFGGSAPVALLSYQLLYGLFQGQIVGIIVGGLALCWWGLTHRNWGLAGVGIILASTKYQLGMTGSLFLLLMAPVSWRERLWVMGVPALTVFISLIVYPGWPLQAMQTLLNNPPWDAGSVSLWRWLGPGALLLWIPPLWAAMPREHRFMALVAATALALPYFQQTDLLFLLVLPLGWLALLGNLGYFFGIYGWVSLQALAILPLLVYMSAMGAAFRTAWRSSLASVETTDPLVKKVLASNS